MLSSVLIQLGPLGPEDPGCWNELCIHLTPSVPQASASVGDIYMISVYRMLDVFKNSLHWV